MAKKTMKFKGIEFEEVSHEIWLDYNKKALALYEKGKDSLYFIAKRKKCSKCGQVVKG